MANLPPKEIVDKALERDELDLLLLGKSEYQFFDRWSSSPYNTDLVAILDALYRFAGEDQREQIKKRLLGAIKKIVDTYEGLVPVAGCILLESGRRSENRPTLGLPLKEIAAELMQSIRLFSFRLEKDKTGVGAQWPDGLLGDLRRLSKNTERVGGPSFCE
jgi:hypothetical protein